MTVYGLPKINHKKQLFGCVWFNKEIIKMQLFDSVQFSQKKKHKNQLHIYLIVHGLTKKTLKCSVLTVYSLTNKTLKKTVF